MQNVYNFKVEHMKTDKYNIEVYKTANNIGRQSVDCKFVVIKCIYILSLRPMNGIDCLAITTALGPDGCNGTGPSHTLYCSCFIGLQFFN